MSNQKPKLSGTAAAVVGCVAIVAIAGLEALALWRGIDGTQFMAVVAAIAALGGGVAGVKVGDIFRRT